MLAMKKHSNSYMGKKFLFNRTTNQWLQWNGNIWAPDMNGSVDRHMLDVAHVRLQSVHAITEDVAVYASIGDTRASKKRAFKEALKLRNVRGRQSALLSATTNPKFARRAEDFNQDPYLFSCSNGVIDPRTGEFRPGLRQDMMTMRTEVPVDRKRQLRPLADVLVGRVPRPSGHAAVPAASDRLQPHWTYERGVFLDPPRLGAARSTRFSSS